MLKINEIEAIIGKEWENYKKKLDKDNLYSRLKKIFELKNVEYKITESKFGRTLYQEVIEIEIDTRKYILPSIILANKTITDLCKENYEYSFYLNGKFLPRSISYGKINELYIDCVKTNNYDAYFKYLDEFYNIDNLSIIIERTVVENKDFIEYKEIIDESISMYLKEYYFSAISLLIPCIEGILRKIINTHLKEEDYYKEKDYLAKALNVILDSWGEIIYPKEKFWFPKEIFESKKYLYMFDLLPIMTHGLFAYLEDFFYGNIEKFKKKYNNETLNRHSIVHGYSTNYGTKNNWLLLFGILDSLLLVSRKFEIFRP